MNGFDSEHGASIPPTQHYAAAFVVQPGASGLAISGLVCGILGLMVFCFVLPSTLAILFSALALPAIGRGEARGKGLAVAGLILGILGFLGGVAFWALAALGPATAPVASDDLSESDRATLVSIGAVQPDEQIDLFYAVGVLSIREGGVLITEGRLVTYDEDLSVESCNLADIRAIEFTPAENMWDDGWFAVEQEDGDETYFTIGGLEGGDNHFDRVLRRKVTEARQLSGRPSPASVLTQPEEGDEE